MHITAPSLVIDLQSNILALQDRLSRLHSALAPFLGEFTEKDVEHALNVFDEIEQQSTMIFQTTNGTETERHLSTCVDFLLGVLGDHLMCCHC